MKLTREDNPASLERYGHLKPARRSSAGRCYQLCPGTARSCGREKGHRGPHAAFGALRRLTAVWDGSGPAAVTQAVDARPETPAGRSRSKKPIGLRSGSPSSPLKWARDWIGLAFGSAEELAWALFFLVFVGFAIGGFLLIYLG